MKKSSKSKPNKKKTRSKIGLGLAIVSIVFVLVASLAGYIYSYRDRILPNISVGGINVGSMTVAKARTIINDRAEAVTNGKVVITVDDETIFEEAVTVLGVEYDVDASISQAQKIGRSGRLLNDLWDYVKVLFVSVSMTPVIEDSSSQIQDYVASIADQVDEAYRDGNLEVVDGVAQVVEPLEGKAISQSEVMAIINQQLTNFALSPFNVNRQPFAPAISAAQAEALSSQAIELTATPLKLEVDGKTFTVNPNKLGLWIKLNIKGAGTSSGTITKPTLDNPLIGEAYVSFSREEVSAYLEEILPEINTEPIDARFTFNDGAMTVLANSQNGRVLNIDKAIIDIISTLESSAAARTVTLEMQDKSAAINENKLQSLASLGIKELIGTGTTSFSGSPSNRIHNIKNGAQYLNGIILAPGEEFSTLDHLGTIDGSTGYLQELVIKNNQTIAEYGGGLCQVSTTLFRAALNTGLEITERRNHAYRVSYYEPPVGMDATIYSPSPDFKFKNNTATYILIQSKVEGKKITFDIYGTSDGRKVEVSDPVMYDVKKSTEIVYIDDPNMPEGETKLKERGHDGAKAKFTQTVYKADGSLLLQDTFISTYVVWPAKYYRGTGPAAEPSAETPAA